MNPLIEAAVRVSPAIVVILAEATLVLLAAILVQPFLRRLPATRHALLLLALITVGLSPVIVLVARHAGLPARVRFELVEQVASPVATSTSYSL